MHCIYLNCAKLKDDIKRVKHEIIEYNSKNNSECIPINIWDVIKYHDSITECLKQVCILSTISACTSVTKELKNAALESLELFLHLPLNSHYPEHDVLYEDMIVFERYIHEPVHLSAGGFFIIDSTLIFKIMGTVASYIIICLGFDKDVPQRESIPAIEHIEKKENRLKIISAIVDEMERLMINNQEDSIASELCFQQEIRKVKRILEKECEILNQLKLTETNPHMILVMYSKMYPLKQHMHQVIILLRGIKAFGKIYGAQVLGICGTVLLFVSDSMKIVVFLVAYDLEDDNEQDFISDVSICIFKFWNSCQLTIWLIIMIHPSYTGSKELSKLYTWYSKILIELPHGIKDYKLNIYKENIIILLKEFVLQKPYFSAAELFEINYALLMYLFTGVITFIVVFVQLR
ncbi:uncharacterized protein LOC130895805 [Diorhabda carinulata]|uniref:uncharacterized protein LOC130895805 n=1 Tax=Diorhabda carinulata TaxID=1163345 RepID=UPI0025A03C6A|nr:uncharacterized protein LOC130895805 [Diorhabda carinulata]